ncbi:biotin/lipoate a/B protein ligase family protein [Sarocladium implicatum]|nr:biotin/lipoate a/B protein ligase family protein [Sarocladium implicatum]
MAIRRLNVLVYTGTGTTVESVRHCLFSLRHLLAPNYAVIPITETVLLKEPWGPTCALLVIPGGGDLGYCRVLNGDGNRKITDYVRRGGAYLGLCAGGYYASKRCEFEVGNSPLEVVGSRELGFFPGICRGAAYKGFEYHGEGGARAVRLKVAKNLFKEPVADEIYSYFNGGGVFVDAKSLESHKVEVLASYADDIDVDGGDGKAAVVFMKLGEGRAVVAGPHPEFAAVNLHPQPSIPGYADLITKLVSGDKERVQFLKACLSKLGLEVSAEDGVIPPLSSLHLSALKSSDVAELLSSWADIIEKEKGEEYIHGETDTFRIQNADTRWNVDELQKSLEPSGETIKDTGITDYQAITKTIVPHEDGYPHPRSTPQFNHDMYYASLRRYRQLESNADTWGEHLLYAECITSTNTLMEKNPKLVSKLPSGFTISATTQIAGRGRGTNVWLAPPGSLLFSTIINHPAHLAATRPIVFIQYLAAVAIVEAIQSYDDGYERLPVKLKWPNDIYALDPSQPRDSAPYVKIGGILSQCVYVDGNFQIILGIGVNAVNPRPTTSIAALLPSSTNPPRIESLLARVVTRLETVYAQFIQEGFSRDLEGRYYRHWLHTGQLVTLEAEGGVKARIVGITHDWGLLRVEETDREGRATGRMSALQSDENSFDYFKGLIRRKI